MLELVNEVVLDVLVVLLCMDLVYETSAVNVLLQLFELQRSCIMTPFTPFICESACISLSNKLCDPAAMSS